MPLWHQSFCEIAGCALVASKQRSFCEIAGFKEATMLVEYKMDKKPDQDFWFTSVI
jgi:hypothetical protein